MRSRVIPETDRPLSRLQLVRTVHLANRQDGIYPLPRHLGQNLVAKVADVSISDVSSSSLELLDCRKLILHYPNPPEAQKAEARTLLIKTH